jgi:NADP-dependent 3-hydroxy acid dehydrogenase YdfG
MSYSLTPRVVWITGASSGIGVALAKRFAAGNDMVIASARSKEKLEALQKDIHASTGACELLVCDVQNEQSTFTAAEAILKKYAMVDVLINNAGVTYFKDFLSTSVQEFDHVINTNLRGLFLTTKAMVPTMVQHHAGKVINILSFVTKTTYTKSSVYSASKAGAEALMNGLRAEVRSEGVQIVNVYPGATLTPIWYPKHQEKFHDQMLKPEDIAEVVFQVSIQPSSMMVEELVLRPQVGDFQV